MNPRVKISRNEEQILAKKKGVQGLDSNNSFFSLYSPKDDDINSLFCQKKNPIHHYQSGSEEELKAQDEPLSTNINFKQTFIS